jgi:hypothetical protein
MSEVSPVPEYLQSTYQLVKCAFPNEITQDEYQAILHFLHPYMSHRTLAEVLSALTNNTYIYVLNDAMGYDLIPTVDYATMKAVLKKLDECGYSKWIAFG